MADSFANVTVLQNSTRVANETRGLRHVADTVPAVADRPNARDPGRVAGRVAFEGVTYASRRKC